MLSEPIEGLETLGCADRNCPFTKHLGGMRTNGGCKCLFEAVRDVQDRRDIQRLIQWKDDEISRLRAEVARLEAGRLKPETVIAARECLSVAWRDSVWGTKRIAELSDAIADLGRCYPPEEA